MTVNQMAEVGRATELQTAWGLNGEVGNYIATIVVSAASVEYFLEQAIWHMQGHAPDGLSHATDAKPVSALVKMLLTEAEKLDAGAGRDLIDLWCKAAVHAFQLRHDIAHGVAVGFTDSLMFVRNPQWRGEKRKLDASSLWGDADQLGMIRDVFAVLLRTIAALSKHPAEAVATPKVLAALRTARSVAGEFDKGHNPSFEKY